jgi:cytochrome c5
MSDAHDEHESVIKTPKQLIVAILAGFLVPIIIIVLLIKFVSSGHTVGAGSNALTSEAIAARISPIANAGYTLIDANAPKVLQTGEAVYSAACVACHGAGIAGAPKFGDTAAWGPRNAQGYDTIVKHAIEGIRGMPAKGGNPDLDDVEVARAVVHMANASGGKFAEPIVKVAAVATPEASVK